MKDDLVEVSQVTEVKVHLHAGTAEVVLELRSGKIPARFIFSRNDFTLFARQLGGIERRIALERGRS